MIDESFPPLFILILFAIFWGVVCYYLAKRKGRKKGIGFIFGFILGIIGVIYYLVVEKKKICPFCKERISAEALICLHCRKEIT